MNRVQLQKAFLLTCCTVCFLFSLKAQSNVGLTAHVSANTRLGLYLDIKDKVVLETRIIDFSALIDTPFELFAFYKFKNEEDFEFYGGLGHGFSASTLYYGLILVVGSNIYPFENKRFGFHVELNPLITEFDNTFVIRASWGIRYTFSWDGYKDNGD